MTSPLLRLPLELRLHIYHHYATNTTRVFKRDLKAEREIPCLENKRILKYHSSVPPLMLVNKQIYREYKSEAKHLAYGLFEVPITADTRYLSPATAEDYDLSPSQKFAVDTVQFDLEFIQHRYLVSDEDKYNSDKQTLTQQLEYIAAFLELCDGVTTVRCQMSLTDDRKNEYFARLCNMFKRFFDSRMNTGDATSLQFVCTIGGSATVEYHSTNGWLWAGHAMPMIRYSGSASGSTDA